ncbi:MAG: hypothetical protein ACRD0U_02605 [Acidimicrobiales bacterium]
MLGTRPVERPLLLAVDAPVTRAGPTLVVIHPELHQGRKLRRKAFSQVRLPSEE